MSKFRPNSFQKKPVPYAAFEQVILVFRPEWVVQSRHVERFFSERIWTKFEHGSLEQNIHKGSFPKFVSLLKQFYENFGLLD